jgi:hypothetical protein
LAAMVGCSSPAGRESRAREAQPPR